MTFIAAAQATITTVAQEGPIAATYCAAGSVVLILLCVYDASQNLLFGASAATTQGRDRAPAA